MFGIMGSEARRRPGYSPWKEALVWTLVVLVIAGAVVGSIALATDWFSGRTAPLAQPGQQTETGTGTGEIVPPADENPPVQTEPEDVAPVAPVVVDYRVMWAEVQGFDPSTIPVEEGFYSGETPNEVSWSPSDPNSIPEGDAFAWEILPSLTGKNRGNTVAAARAPANKDVVLASLSMIGDGNYILLSVNGGESWCSLGLLPVDSNGDEAVAVRVATYGEQINLYGQDPRPGSHWWTTTVDKNALPCS